MFLTIAINLLIINQRLQIILLSLAIRKSLFSDIIILILFSISYIVYIFIGLKTRPIVKNLLAI